MSWVIVHFTLVLQGQPNFDKPSNGKSLSKIRKDYLSLRNVFFFSPLLCSFIGSHYFSLNFSAFLKVWTNPEIQDGRHLTIMMSLQRHVRSSLRVLEVK